MLTVTWHWIRTVECLPYLPPQNGKPRSVRCLTYGPVHGVIQSTFTETFIKRERIWKTCFGKNIQPTHWMEMPSPPEDEYEFPPPPVDAE